MKDSVKVLFFRHHWWFVTILAVAAAILILRSSLPEKGTVLGVVIAGALSMSFFAQQQKLAEMNLFKQLITEFSERYDRIDGQLNAILRAGRAELTELQTIIGYFNLCAEEYLFYSEGYIHPRVWRAWCKGMLQYFDAEPFRGQWEIEVVTDSCYGLTVDEIRKCAGSPAERPRPRRRSRR